MALASISPETHRIRINSALVCKAERLSQLHAAGELARPLEWLATSHPCTTLVHLWVTLEARQQLQCNLKDRIRTRRK
jgi:hypothetical protein